MQVELDFLRKAYFAADDTSVAPEWPPPPSRLFAACLQACKLNGLEEHVPLLEKLEKQSPPRIFTGGRFTDSKRNNASTKDFYVPTPVSDGDRGKDPLFLVASKKKKNQPVTHLQESRVVYSWDTADFSEKDMAGLNEVCEEVTHVGRGCSLVVAQCGAHFSMKNLVEHYIPDEEGEIAIKVPEKGSLASLERAFAQRRHYDHWNVSFYRRQGQSRALSTVWNEVIVLKTHGRVHVSRTLPMTEAIRSRILSFETGGAGSIPIPSVFHGHGLEGRMSHAALMPLPYVGGPHGSGMIKGFALCLPNYISADDRDNLLKAINRLSEVGFRLHGEHIAVSMVGAEPLHSLRKRRWVSHGSKRWVSATPVALDRKPKKNLPVEAILARMCNHIGLPTPTKAFYQKEPLVQGSPASFDFRVQRKGKSPLAWGHVELEFDQLVKGPVLLGQLRHFGLGTFLPAADEGDQ